jgi:hypothetical protein
MWGIIHKKQLTASGVRLCDSSFHTPMLRTLMRCTLTLTLSQRERARNPSLTPVSSLGGSSKDDESIAAANENGTAMAFT